MIFLLLLFLIYIFTCFKVCNIYAFLFLPLQEVQKRIEREKKKTFAFPKMDVSPAITEVGGYSHNIPAVETDSDEDEDVCRICRSPEEPGNPLRYPCLCRGSIKYVHQDCLRLWLNRCGNKQCEVIARLLFRKLCGFEILTFWV